MEEIWKAMEYVQELKPVGFDREIIDTLNRERVIGSPKYSFIEKNIADDYSPVISPVPYAKRYADREFLVLANGSCLKTYKHEIKCFIKKYITQ